MRTSICAFSARPAGHFFGEARIENTMGNVPRSRSELQNTHLTVMSLLWPKKTTHMSSGERRRQSRLVSLVLSVLSCRLTSAGCRNAAPPRACDRKTKTPTKQSPSCSGGILETTFSPTSPATNQPRSLSSAHSGSATIFCGCLLCCRHCCCCNG